MMKPICVGREICGDPEAAGKLEWLETNGLGGSAASSIIGMNTRRYHGLLTAATLPPVGRVAMLSKLEETVTVAGRRYELACNRYPGALHPEGSRYLREFRLDRWPVFVYDLDGVAMEKRVFMVAGENTTVIEYTAGADCTLELRPLISFRDYHSTTHRNDALNPKFENDGGVVVLRPYGDLPALYLAHNATIVAGGAGWYYNFEYDRERERGLDFREDLYNPLAMTFGVASGAAATVIASTMRHQASESAMLLGREMERRAVLVAAAPRDGDLVQRLTAAADQFLVQRGEWKTVIAGYPWFSDWGRDTMISLPGLTLVTGRYETARKVLLAFVGSMDQGMVPNRFPDDGGKPEYNTADGTLWFFEAIRAYGEYTGDYEFIRRSLWAATKASIDWHVRGTRYGIRVDVDGLLGCGEAGVQLTWMDAKVGDWVVTPRRGKPVEIQALWYNALRIMQDLALRFEDGSGTVYGEMADKARGSFRGLFWNEEAGCLYDVVDGDTRDAAVRPNQIFAVSLTHTMLEDGDARRVVEVMERELLTPVGLRTLSPHDPAYRGRYEGDVVSRDSAYHQGTVWPWLMGPFLTAYARLKGGSEPARWLGAFEEALRTGCLGQIGEVADGDAPYRPGGCVAQAWSVAEILRAAVEVGKGTATGDFVGEESPGGPPA
jgi:predicted glycogen debranching enzyme